jgi:hypothetical protein
MDLPTRQAAIASRACPMRKNLPRLLGLAVAMAFLFVVAKYGVHDPAQEQAWARKIRGPG